MKRHKKAKEADRAQWPEPRAWVQALTQPKDSIVISRLGSLYICEFIEG